MDTRTQRCTDDPILCPTRLARLSTGSSSHFPILPLTPYCAPTAHHTLQHFWRQGHLWFHHSQNWKQIYSFWCCNNPISKRPLHCHDPDPGTVVFRQISCIVHPLSSPGVDQQHVFLWHDIIWFFSRHCWSLGSGFRFWPLTRTHSPNTFEWP